MSVPHRYRGLWYATILVVLVGGGLTYVFSLDPFDPGRVQAMVVSLSITIFIAGILIISATADWWMHR